MSVVQWFIVNSTCIFVEYLVIDHKMMVVYSKNQHKNKINILQFQADDVLVYWVLSETSAQANCLKIIHCTAKPALLY